METTGREKAVPTPAAKPSIDLGKTPSIDALSLLAAQHREVDALFTEFEAANESDFLTKEKIIAKIARKLDQHAQLEESYFYPIVRRFDAGTIAKAEEEHSHIKLMVAKIDELSSEDEGFDATVFGLKELVTEHFAEEESQVFAECRTKLSARTLRDLGAKMQSAARTAEAPASYSEPGASRQGEETTIRSKH